MKSRFAHELGRRVLLLDGAMGTSVHALEPDVDRDYLGKENCVEILLDTRPEWIQQIHEEFLEAGADAVETNTFGASRHVLAEFDLADDTYRLNVRAAEVARAACARYSTEERPRFVVGSIGPGTKLITLGQISWDAMQDSYAEQARGLIDGGVDALLVETAQDILQVKCALTACLRALRECGRTPEEIPLLASVTIETNGTMLLGTEIAAAAEALRGYPLLSLGLNCATGPVEMTEHLHWLGRNWDRFVSTIPNAGLPVLLDGHAHFPLTPDDYSRALIRFVEHEGVRLVGGCCGTRPAHIRALAEALDARGWRDPKGAVLSSPPAKTVWPRGASSLYAVTSFRQDTSFLIVGERTNSNGSRRFKRLLAEENWDELVSLGREQVRDGSHVIDVCVDFVGRNGAQDMTEVVNRFAQQVAVPLMIDSTQIDVLEAGLKHAPGKCIVNSMNLEEGEEKLARIVALARTYGAAIVAGTIDEDPREAMGKTAERKLQIAERIHALAVGKYGLPEEDLLFDPLVLPITTGVEADRRLALETIEGIRRIAQRFPACQTMIGLSNVSFGLKPAARVVLNSVFLHECLEAGLTGAIVHASSILPRNRIEPEQWEAAQDLLYDRRREGHDPLTVYIDLFPEEGEVARSARPSLADLPLEERLRRHIIDGEKKGLESSLSEALTRYPALEIVNDHLLHGMKEVGRLFASGAMQLPFVLQSAEVMKASVAQLEPHMPKVEGASRGRMVLATVKGDVHDIGKNLVDIILTNNGYDVVNLGIKQPLSAILDALETHKADAIGLSGLLVKSVGVMQENLEEISRLGFTVPVILGGAALTRTYCEETLRAVYPKTYYGGDAFEGLAFMDRVANGALAELDAAIEKRRGPVRTPSAGVAAGVAVGTSAGGDPVTPDERPSDVARGLPVPTPPFWGSRVISTIDLDEIYPYVNKRTLFRGQWQLRRGGITPEEAERQVQELAEPTFRRLAALCRDERILRPAVVYGYYPVQSDGNELVVYDPEDPRHVIERFRFPRQATGKRLCIADFFRSIESEQMDVLGLSCVTMGSEISIRTKLLYERNEYTEYLFLHGFGVECAEGLAELWHKRMRMELGFSSEDASSIAELFQQKYRGSRYSFGYPACPDLSDQEKLFGLLRPERIGCVLTDNWQIDPEQSTSALVVHHPEAKYFNL